MRVFVTGSTGLLGQNLVRALRAQGHEVIALTRSLEKLERFLGDVGVTPVQGDMRDVRGFAGALRGVDAVFHTAAYFREYYHRGEHAEHLEAINVTGTLEVIDAAARAHVSAFVHTSSSGTIGQKPDGSPGDEDTPPGPRQLKNLYFRSKYDGEKRIRTIVPATGMRVIEILPGWMWGPGDAGPTAAGQLALDFMAGKLPAVPGGGTMVVDARDVAQAMTRAVDRAHGERFLIAGNYLRTREIVDGLAKASGRPAPGIDIPIWLGLLYARGSELSAKMRNADRATVSLEGMRVLAEGHRFSSAKAERQLGARFRPFAETAHDVVRFYVEHGFVRNPAAAKAGTSRSGYRSPDAARS